MMWLNVERWQDGRSQKEREMFSAHCEKTALPRTAESWHWRTMLRLAWRAYECGFSISCFLSSLLNYPANFVLGASVGMQCCMWAGVKLVPWLVECRD